MPDMYMYMHVCQVQIEMARLLYMSLPKAGSLIQSVLFTTDMACLSLPLSEEPNFGTWRIAATIKVHVTACLEPLAIDVLLAGHVTLPFPPILQLPREPGTGDCRASHSPPRASCTFKVDEFGKE